MPVSGPQSLRYRQGFQFRRNFHHGGGTPRLVHARDDSGHYTSHLANWSKLLPLVIA